MLMRLFVSAIVLIALVAGSLVALKLQNDQLIRLIIFRDFFDVTLPILGFGALIKYLCSCQKCKCCCGPSSCGTSNKGMTDKKECCPM